MIGDGLAPSYFTINQQTGSISVIKDLRTDSSDSYDLRIVAEDGGSPPRMATAVATVEVLRNFYAPVFSPLTYNATVLETLGLGASILRVAATDADRTVRVDVLKLF